MIEIAGEHIADLRQWFLPERPGRIVGLHVVHTGNGVCLADCWPEPRAILAETAGNYSLVGYPDVLQPADLHGHIAGFVEAPDRFVPLLKAAFPDLRAWDRVFFEQRERPRYAVPHATVVRRLGPADVAYLSGLSPESIWIAKTWGGLAGLAASGMAWGAFVDDHLVAVACTFFVGEQTEELGVVTERGFRGLGLSAACAGGLCEDIRRRGRRPTWTTSPDNAASIRVAEKLGFRLQDRDYSYVIGIPIPAPARQDAGT